MYTREGSSKDLGERDRGSGLGAFRERSGFHGRGEPLHDHEHANGHFALIYETTEERLAATVPFLRRGLDRGEHCLYVVERPSERTEIVEALREAGVSVDAAVESGALNFATVGETYLRSEPFDPDEMLAFYEDTIDDALEEYGAFRVVAGTDWIDDVPLETFMEYEGRVNALFDERHATSLCHYDRTQLPADVISDVVRTHPHLIYDENVCHNFYYTPPDELLDSGSTNHETDRMLQTLRDRTEAKTKLAEHERFLRRLNGVMACPDRSFEEKLQALFDLGCERFDMELGGLNRVDHDEDWFEPEYLSDEHDYFESGVEIPLSETYCRAPAEVMDTATVSDPVREGFDGITVYEEYEAQAYIGTHISVSGGEERTLAFITSEPREEPFSEEDRTFIGLMGQWVKYELEHQHNTDQLAAVNSLNEVARAINRELVQQSTRGEIEEVVCEHLAASDSYDVAWIGTVDDRHGEIVPSTTANADDHLDGETIAVDEGECPAGTAIRTSETQIRREIAKASCDVWSELAREYGLSASGSVPLVYEDRTYGVLNVFTSRTRAFDDEERAVITQLGEIVGLTIAAIEREEKLQHERERLELLNRLLRHNLLNGLNLVNARLDLLEGRVDFEAVDDLETASDRTSEMIDLIETLRTLTEGLIHDEYELESVDLGSVLENELDGAREACDDAVFEVRADLDSVPAIRANGLLEEAFENVLGNAVRHNDEGIPRVTVDVTTDEESVTVQVRDNGPGVPAQMQEMIFEKGQKSFESPGTGFGLHLVREIVNVYDGSVTVEDNDPEGAVFSITLPRSEVGD
jgi:signal transduction histidine kinase/uncharacterized protein YbaA (DUF1428 family)